jgi:hypothetical protein
VEHARITLLIAPNTLGLALADLVLAGHAVVALVLTHLALELTLSAVAAGISLQCCVRCVVRAAGAIFALALITAATAGVLHPGIRTCRLAKLAAVLAWLVLVLVIAAVVAAFHAGIIGVFARAACDTAIGAGPRLEAAHCTRFAHASIREPTAVMVLA